MNEYEYEPIRGLPERLPEGEYIIWQGEPEWGALARRVFHVRAVMVYFALLLAWYLWTRVSTGTSPVGLLSAASWPLMLGTTALIILYGLAWAFARSTVYTLTNRRIVMRFGVAIPMMINVPLDKIESADLAAYGEFGDIALTLAPGERISYLALWPHARPWHIARVKPMLRGLPNVAVATALLADAVQCDKLVGECSTARDGVGRPARQRPSVVSTQPLAT
jgi:hypothetical protein